MNKKRIFLLLFFTFFLSIFTMKFSISAAEKTEDVTQNYLLDAITATPSPSPEAGPAPVKDDKTWKAEIKLVKKEIDAVRKSSRAVLKEIKRLKKNYEDILKKMQKDPSSVTITESSLEHAKEVLVLIEGRNNAIRDNTALVKTETSTYNSQYRSKNYSGAYDSYQKILSLEKQILSDYETVRDYYTGILQVFVL